MCTLTTLEARLMKFGKCLAVFVNWLCSCVCQNIRFLPQQFEVFSPCLWVKKWNSIIFYIFAANMLWDYYHNLQMTWSVLWLPCCRFEEPIVINYSFVETFKPCGGSGAESKSKVDTCDAGGGSAGAQSDNYTKSCTGSEGTGGLGTMMARVVNALIIICLELAAIIPGFSLNLLVYSHW